MLWNILLHLLFMRWRRYVSRIFSPIQLILPFDRLFRCIVIRSKFVSVYFQIVAKEIHTFTLY